MVAHSDSWLLSGGTSGKELACQSGRPKEKCAWSLGQEDGRSLEEGMTIHPSILEYRILRTEEPGGLESIGSHKDSTQLKQISMQADS